MFHLIFTLPWLYVVSRTLMPLPWPMAVKIAVALVLLIASQYHYWSRLSSGSVFSPEFPRPIIIVFNGVFGAMTLLAAFQIALDLATLPSITSPVTTIRSASSRLTASTTALVQRAGNRRLMCRSVSWTSL